MINRSTLRLPPLVNSAFSKPRVIALIAVCSVSLLLALVLGFMPTGKPGNPTGDHVFRLPDEISLPDTIGHLPDNYSQLQEQPQAVQPRQNEQLLATLARLENQLATAAARQQTLEQTVNQELARVRSGMTQDVSKIKTELTQALQQNMSQAIDQATASSRRVIENAVQRAESTLIQTSQMLTAFQDQQLARSEQAALAPPSDQPGTEDAEINESPILFAVENTGESSEPSTSTTSPAISDTAQSSEVTPTIRNADVTNFDPVNSSGSVIKAGTFIPSILITEIDSSLPGTVIAQVSENIYDSRYGNRLLLPQGSRMIGRYESLSGPATSRLQLSFNRIVRPDGLDISLPETTPMADGKGISGITGDVDNHWGQVALVSLLTAAFNYNIAAIEQPQSTLGVGQDGQILVTGNSGRDVAKANALRETNRTLGDLIIERLVPEAPNIKIPIGQPFNILVSDDIQLPDYSA